MARFTPGQLTARVEFKVPVGAVRDEETGKVYPFSFGIERDVAADLNAVPAEVDYYYSEPEPFTFEPYTEA